MRCLPNAQLGYLSFVHGIYCRSNAEGYCHGVCPSAQWRLQLESLVFDLCQQRDVSDIKPARSFDVTGNEIEKCTNPYIVFEECTVQPFKKRLCSAKGSS